MSTTNICDSKSQDWSKSFDQKYNSQYSVLKALKDQGAEVIESRYAYGELTAKVNLDGSLIDLKITVPQQTHPEMYGPEVEDPYGEVERENCGDFFSSPF